MIKIDSSGNKITVKGNIKSITHYNQIKNIIDDMVANNKAIVIHLVDSISLTSSIIGYFSKLTNVNGIILKLFVNDDHLFNLLEDLGLTQTFNVQRLRHED